MSGLRSSTQINSTFGFLFSAAVPVKIEKHSTKKVVGRQANRIMQQTLTMPRRKSAFKLGGGNQVDNFY
jgi:hypothetical protein